MPIHGSSRIRRLNIVSLIIFLIWSSSMLFLYDKDKEEIFKKNRDLILMQAKNSFEKNFMFRQWVAMHGGVYIQPTPATPPNKYLEFLPDRDLETLGGKKLTLMNPAYVLKEFFNTFPSSTGETGHITSLKPINPDNVADEWETKALEAFEKGESREYYEFVEYQEEPHFRYIKALETKESCLKCHAEQGYELGDIRGAITINLPTQNFDLIGLVESKKRLFIYFVSWIIGCLIIAGVYLKLRKDILLEIQLDREKEHQDKIISQQAKMAAMGEMIDNIAHQWRQPLSIISTLSSGMQFRHQMGTLGEEELDRITKNINDQVDYLSNTIDDFRGFFREDKSFDENTNEAILDKTLKILSSKLKNRDIHIEKNIEPVAFFTLKNELIQALLNVISNAIDALEKTEKELRYLQINSYVHEQELVFEITDSAGGIEEKSINRIFEPYFTTKPKEKGTGIGLYMTEQIITKNLNGSIEVKNVELTFNQTQLQGACFRISLPFE